MNLISKISISVGFISFLTLIIARVFLGGWIDYLWWPLSFFLISFITSFVFGFKFYWSFLTMRTSKEGMSLGLSVLILITILSSVAILSSTWDRTFDFTEEKIHTLSDQTVKVLNSMKEDIRISVFYKGKEGKKLKGRAERDLDIFKKNAPFIKVRFYDAHVKNKLAMEYIEPLSNKREHSLFAFVEHQSKKVRIDLPMSEEKILSALIKVSRRSAQRVYYTTGHGERDFHSSNEEGLEAFRKSLEESSYELTEWNFIEEKQGLPKDAAALLIIGPTKIFFEQEIKWIKEYLDSKGNLFIALDPSRAHNLSSFLKDSLGVDFKNNFIININPLLGLGETIVRGVEINRESVIMKSFPGKINVVFSEASELDFHPSIGAHLEKGFLIKSPPHAITIKDFKNPKKIKGSAQAKIMGLYVLETSTSKDKKSDEEKQKEGFSVVVFGDSDFVSNKAWNYGSNKDLSLNIISYLTDGGELISIRPKTPTVTKITLHGGSKGIMILFCILLSLVFFISSGFMFYARLRS